MGDDVANKVKKIVADQGIIKQNNIEELLYLIVYPQMQNFILQIPGVQGKYIKNTKKLILYN